MKVVKVIQITPERRLKSYRYGWELQQLVTPENPTKTNPNCEPQWKEDSPAYPGTLAQGLSDAVYRVFRDNPDTDLSQLTDDLTKALRALDNIKMVSLEKADKLLNGVP